MKRIINVLVCCIIFSCTIKEDEKVKPQPVPYEPHAYDKYVYNQFLQEDRFDSLLPLPNQIDANCSANDVPTLYDPNGFRDYLGITNTDSAAYYIKPSIAVDYLELSECNYPYVAKDSILAEKKVISSVGISNIKETLLMPYTGFDLGRSGFWDPSLTVESRFSKYIRFEYKGKEYYVCKEEHLKKLIGKIDNEQELAFYLTYVKRFGPQKYKKVAGGYEFLGTTTCNALTYKYSVIRYFLDDCGNLTSLGVVEEGVSEGPCPMF